MSFCDASIQQDLHQIQAQGRGDLRFFHACTFGGLDDPDVRSISTELVKSRLEFDEGALNLARNVCEMFREQWEMRTLQPGKIDVAPARLKALAGLNNDSLRHHRIFSQLGLESSITDEARKAIDCDILYCRGSYFHNDMHGWSDSIFVNWMLDGPPVDLVAPYLGQGGRIRLEPGACFAFDPSQPHGLTRPVENSFLPDQWSEQDSPCVFLNWVVPFTPGLDAIFGIERSDRGVFSQRARWLDMDVIDFLINENDGLIRSRSGGTLPGL